MLSEILVFTSINLNTWTESWSLLTNSECETQGNRKLGSENVYAPSPRFSICLTDKVYEGSSMHVFCCYRCRVQWWHGCPSHPSKLYLWVSQTGTSELTGKGDFLRDSWVFSEWVFVLIFLKVSWIILYWLNSVKGKK